MCPRLLGPLVYKSFVLSEPLAKYLMLLYKVRSLRRNPDIKPKNKQEL
jgi:hypothetical protein